MDKNALAVSVLAIFTLWRLSKARSFSIQRTSDTLWAAVCVALVTASCQIMFLPAGSFREIGGDDLASRTLISLIVSAFIYPMTAASILKNGGIAKDWILILLPFPLGIFFRRMQSFFRWMHSRAIESARP